MLLTRSLPPPFLLPAWGTRQLLRALQRAHQSTTNGHEEPVAATLELEARRKREIIPPIRKAIGEVHEKPLVRKYVPVDGGLIMRSRFTDRRIQRRRLERVLSEEISKPSQGPPTEGVHRDPTGSSWASQSLPTGRIDDALAGLSKGARSLRLRETDRSSKASKGISSTPSIRKKRAHTEDWRYARVAFPDTDGLSRLRSSLANSSESGQQPTENQSTSSDSEPELSPKQDFVDQDPTKQKPSKQWSGSLFDEIFPEESKTTEEDKKKEEVKQVDKLPVFDWGSGPRMDWDETVRRAAKERKDWFNTIPEAPATAEVVEKQTKRSVGVLVLSSASKTLEMSDFFRLGEKGEHIEGWTSGIVKVIQARSPHTLEPLGHYFLIFSSDVAASTYLQQMLLLHRLSARHGGNQSPISIPSKFLRPGEDMKTVLRGFSLVPGQSKIYLRLLDKPYSAAVKQILDSGGSATIATHKTRSEDMVILSLDSRDFSWQDVKRAINADGKKRNMHWQLSEEQGAVLKVDGNAGVVAEGRASVRGPAKFIVSFKDPNEARRFVREWHRRPFPTQKDVRLGDEPPPIMDAEIFW